MFISLLAFASITVPSNKPFIKSLPTGIESRRDRILFVAKTTPVIRLIKDVWTFCMRKSCDLTLAQIRT